MAVAVASTSTGSTYRAGGGGGGGLIMLRWYMAALEVGLGWRSLSATAADCNTGGGGGGGLLHVFMADGGLVSLSFAMSSAIGGQQSWRTTH
jgi:hypothetical protein